MSPGHVFVSWINPIIHRAGTAIQTSTEHGVGKGSKAITEWALNSESFRNIKRATLECQEMPVHGRGRKVRLALWQAL